MKDPVVSNLRQQRFDEQLHAAYRLVARHVYRVGRLGAFGYAAFDYINATFFEGKLPETLLLWQLTEHGHALGECRSSEDGPPVISLHPALVYPAKARLPSSEQHREKRWSILREWLGFCYAFDVLLHECIHADINYVLGGWERLQGERGQQRSKWSSHNNPLWVGECNRIARLLGQDTVFDMKKYRRKNGRLQYGCDGLDFEHFPACLPDREAFYLAKKLPFPF
jgi:hypothetical protein